MSDGEAARWRTAGEPGGEDGGNPGPRLRATTGAVRDLVTAAGRVTVLTGAGVSTGAGTPDLRGPEGLWWRDPAGRRTVEFQAYREDPELRVTAWRMRRDHPVWRAEPNPAHRAVVDLERSGRLVAVVTQNTDGLHQRAGSDPSRVLELRGTVHETECLGCGWLAPTREVLARVEAGEPDPPCPDCGGILKVATVSPGQALDPDVLHAAVTAVQDSELLLAVGTSLTEQVVASLAEIAVRSGGRLVVVNAEPTPHDGIAAACLHGDVVEVLPLVLRDLPVR
ncbi:MAG: NAD-dependent deacetylase [Actinomycetales bacterium]|nr:NAD-dependent deacetylase [Actinomycetales bacterium]